MAKTPLLPAVENDWKPVDVVAPNIQIANDWKSTGIVIPTRPEEMSELDRTVVYPFQRGMVQAGQMVDTLRGVLGVYTPEELARETIQNDLEMRQFPDHPEDAAEAQRRAGLEGWDQVGAVLTNPRLWAQTAVQSLPAMGPSIGGALAGAPAGPIGVGAGMGVGSAITEFNHSLMDAIREVAPDGGVTEESLVEALRDPVVMGRAREYAAKRGVATGIFDAISGMLAGRLFGPVADALGGKTAGKIAGAGVETVTQAASGMAGETAAQLASRGKITSPQDIALEGVAEIPGAAIEPVINRIPQMLRGKETNPADSLPFQPAPVPTEPVDNPNVQSGVVPEEWVPVMPTAPAQVQPEPEAEVWTPVEPEPQPEPEAPPAQAPAQAPTPQPKPAAPTINLTPGRGAERVSTPDKSFEMDTEFEVVDLPALQAAQGVDQPRDRAGRAASDAQIRDIASKLDPLELLSSRNSDTGAPIIDENGIVLSGNGRRAAIELASQEFPDRYAAYRSTLEQLGYDTTGMTTPVLVRRVKGLSPEQRLQVTGASNVDNKQAMSAPERARMDTRYISPDMLAGFNSDVEDGVTAAANSDFVRRFIGNMPEAERNAMQTKGLGLSEEGARRISNAIFAAAYGDKDLIDRATENNTDPAIRNALLGAAAAWGNMRNSSPDFDITPDLVKAIGVVNSARGKNMNLTQFLAQMDAFDQVPERVQNIARLFYNQTGTRLAAWRDVRDRLREYANAGGNTANAAGDMFGDRPGPDEVLSGLLTAMGRGPEAQPEPAPATPAKTGGDNLFGNETLSTKPMTGKAPPPSEGLFGQPEPEPAPASTPTAEPEGKRDIRFQKFDAEAGGPPKGHQRATMPDGSLVAFWKNEGDGGTSIKGEWLMMPLTAKGSERSIPDGSAYDRLEGTNIYDLKELREKFLSGQLDAQIKRLLDAADEWERIARERNYKMINGAPNPNYRAEGAPAASKKAAAAPSMEDASGADMKPLGDDRKPSGTLAPQTEDVSMSVGRSIYEEAFRAAGLDPDEGVLLPPAQKISLLKRLMVDTFGFRAFEMAGVNAKDAVNQMLNAYRNVRFMMHALALPVKGVSLNGTLAVTLENAGKRYFGVYRPAERAIGMPGKSNSFAHEWAHALDHYLADAIKGQADALLSQWTRSKGLDPNVSIENAFINLIHTMFFEDAAVALKTLDLEREAAEVIKKGPNAGQPTAKALLARDQLVRLKSGSTRINLPKSEYRTQAQDYDPNSDYWSSVHEMLARAFEAYVASKVEALGGTNEFITKGEAAYLSDADRRLAMTFPKAEDRLRIFSAIDDVMDHIRTGAMLGKDPAAPRPDDVDIVDPQHWNKAVLAQGGENLIEQIVREGFAVRNSLRTAVRQGLGASLKSAVSELALRAGINPNMTIKDAASAVLDLTRFFLFSLRGTIRPRIARNKGKGAGFMQDVVDDFATITGDGKTQARTYEEERTQEAIKDINQIEAVLRANGKADLRLSKAENDTVRELLFGAPVPGADPVLKKIAAAYRRLMDDIHTRAEKAGIGIGYIMDKGYLPRVLNPSAVNTDPRGFVTAATELYRKVFDQITGSMTDADLLRLSREVDHRQGNTTGTSRYAGLDRALRKAMKAAETAAARQQALPATATAAERAAAKKAVADTLADLKQARGDLKAALRDPFAEVSAEDWLTRVQIGDSVTYDSHGPASDFAKTRSLPSEADEIMADFYNTDVVNLVANYANHVNARAAYVRRAGNTGGTDRFNDVIARRSVQDRISRNPKKYDVDTEDGRRAIINDLANPKTDNLLGMRLREAQRAGANAEDVIALRGAIDSITGRGDRGPLVPYLERFSGFIYGYTYLRLLPRAAITSLVEPVSVLLRTGSAKATFRTFAAYLSEINQKAQSVQERQAIARAVGLTTSPLYDVILMSRLGMDHGHITSANVALSNFFQANFLTAVTNAQRRSVMIGGFQWLRDMAQMHAMSKTSAVQKKTIEAEFRELGLRDEDIPSFMDWLRQKDTLPSLTELESKAGVIFQHAIHRLTGQIIQNPTRADKPMPASSALGRLVYALTAYLYAFFSNVHAATVTRTARNYRIARDEGQGKLAAGITAGLPAAKSFVGGFAVLFAAQALTTVLREAMFNNEQFEKHREDGDLGAWLLGLAWSRTGVFGPADVVFNAMTGIKYERDLSNMMIGPGLQSIFSDLQNVWRVFTEKNSPNTNTAEREAAKSIYRLLVSPTVSLVLSSMQAAGPVTAGARFTGLVYLTSNEAASNFADMVAGPKPEK
jgi:hypothetical protein